MHLVDAPFAKRHLFSEQEKILYRLQTPFFGQHRVLTKLLEGPDAEIYAKPLVQSTPTLCFLRQVAPYRRVWPYRQDQETIFPYRESYQNGFFVKFLELFYKPHQNHKEFFQDMWNLQVSDL